MIHVAAVKLAHLDLEESNVKEWRRDTQKQLFSLGINSVSKLLIHIPTLNKRIKKERKGNIFDKSTLELFIKLGIRRLLKNQPAFFPEEDNIKDMILDAARKLGKSRKWTDEITLELRNINIKTISDYIINYFDINSKLYDSNMMPFENEE